MSSGGTATPSSPKRPATSSAVASSFRPRFRNSRAWSEAGAAADSAGRLAGGSSSVEGAGETAVGPSSSRHTDQKSRSPTAAGRGRRSGSRAGRWARRRRRRVGLAWLRARPGSRADRPGSRADPFRSRRGPRRRGRRRSSSPPDAVPGVSGLRGSTAARPPGRSDGPSRRGRRPRSRSSRKRSRPGRSPALSPVAPGLGRADSPRPDGCRPPRGRTTARPGDRLELADLALEGLGQQGGAQLLAVEARSSAAGPASARRRPAPRASRVAQGLDALALALRPDLRLRRQRALLGPDLVEQLDVVERRPPRSARSARWRSRGVPRVRCARCGGCTPRATPGRCS